MSDLVNFMRTTQVDKRFPNQNQANHCWYECRKKSVFLPWCMYVRLFIVSGLSVL